MTRTLTRMSKGRNAFIVFCAFYFAIFAIFGSGCSLLGNGSSLGVAAGGTNTTQLNQTIEANVLAEVSSVFGSSAAHMTQVQRNALQDGLLADADAKCSSYVNSLGQSQKAVDAPIGTLESILGGVGAIVTDVTVARSLAGSASILKSGRGEFDQDRFADTVMNVIINGMDTRRERLKRTILTNQTRALSGYGTRRAIGDALQYHHACSLMSGLLEANDTLTLRKYAVSEEPPHLPTDDEFAFHTPGVPEGVPDELLDEPSATDSESSPRFKTFATPDTSPNKDEQRNQIKRLVSVLLEQPETQQQRAVAWTETLPQGAEDTEDAEKLKTLKMHRS